MNLLYFILGISITLNLITIFGLFIIYKKFMRDNPLSSLYKMPKKEKEETDIISKMKKKAEMENWDI